MYINNVNRFVQCRPVSVKDLFGMYGSRMPRGSSSGEGMPLEPSKNDVINEVLDLSNSED